MRNPLSLEETRSNAALVSRWLHHYGREVAPDAAIQHRCLNHYPSTVVRPFEDAAYFYACLVCGAHHICCSDSRTCERRDGYCMYRALFVVQHAPCRVSDEQARFELVKQWMLYLERYHFIYNIGGGGGPGHQCLDPENAAVYIVRPFEAIDYFYGCTMCGRYHICYGDHVSCDSVDISLNPNSDHPICAYSGEAIRNKLNLTMGWADERRCEIDMKLCDFDRFARTDSETKPIKPSSYTTVYARAEHEHARALQAIRAASPSSGVGVVGGEVVTNDREQRQIDRQNMNKYFRAGGAAMNRVKDKKQQLHMQMKQTTNRIDRSSTSSSTDDDDDEYRETNARILRTMKEKRKRKRVSTGGCDDADDTVSDYESLELYSPSMMVAAAASSSSEVETRNQRKKLTLRHAISAPPPHTIDENDDAMQLFIQASSDDSDDDDAGDAGASDTENDTYDPIRAVRRRAERDDARRAAIDEATALTMREDEDADAYDADGVYIEAATTLFGDGGGGDDDDARAASTVPSLFDTTETATHLKNVHDNTRFWDCYYGFLLDKNILRARTHPPTTTTTKATVTNDPQFPPDACLYNELQPWFLFDAARLSPSHAREIRAEVERIVRMLLAVSLEHRRDANDDEMEEDTLERLATSLTGHYTHIVTNIIALVYHSPYMHQLAKKRYEKQEKQCKSSQASKITISITDISKLFDASSREKQHLLLQQQQPTALGEHHSVHDLLGVCSLCAALMLHALTEKFVLTDSRSNHVYVWASDHWLHYMKQQHLLERLVVDVSASAAAALSRRDDTDTVTPVHRRPDAVMSFMMAANTGNRNGNALFSHKELVDNSTIIRSALTAYTQAPLWLHTAIFYDLLLPPSYYGNET